MNPQMDVLYLQDTGHVLGIFTRTSEPGQIETDASAFVGDGLHLGGLVTGQSVDLIIPPAMVGIFRTDRNWRQILQPGTLYVSGLPSTPTLSLFVGNLPATPGFSKPNLTITLPGGTSGTILVLAVDKTGGAPVPFNPSFVAATTSVVISMTGLTTGGTYEAFVFVPTYPVVMVTFTAP